MSNHHILLLKNTDTDGSPSEDPYVKALSSQSILSSIIPTLSHSYIEAEQLGDIISRGGGEEYGGVIVTSGRAVDAWGNAIGRIRETDVAGGGGWESTPFYVVGPRTQAQLLSLRAQTPTKLSRFLPSPDLILGAQESGNGEALGRFISIDYPARRGSNLPLLYLVGDKNAGGVEGVLKETDIGLRAVQVYATSPSVMFEEDFEVAIRQVAEGKPVCIVFFAPSSAELALPTIRKHFAIQPLSNTQEIQPDGRPQAKIVAIGPTTARALSGKHRIYVHAVSKKPEPSALVDAIVSLSSSS